MEGGKRMERGHMEGSTTKPQAEWVAAAGWMELFSQVLAEVVIRGDLPKNLWKHSWKKTSW